MSSIPGICLHHMPVFFPSDPDKTQAYDGALRTECCSAHVSELGCISARPDEDVCVIHVLVWRGCPGIALLRFIRAGVPRSKLPYEHRSCHASTLLSHAVWFWKARRSHQPGFKFCCLLLLASSTLHAQAAGQALLLLWESLKPKLSFLLCPAFAAVLVGVCLGD